MKPVFTFITVYLHADRGDMWQQGEELGLTDETLRMFSFACNEVQAELKVDMTTGLAQITKVDGRVVK